MASVTTSTAPVGSTVMAPALAPASSAYWDGRCASWHRIAPPLRPGPDDVRVMVDAASDWARWHGPPRIVLFGVTPELAAAGWPERSRLLAVDYSMGMIRDVWPGPPGASVLCADWRALPLRAGSADLVVGDGCFAMTRYPDDYGCIGAGIRRLLGRAGVCVMRFFVRPPRAERPEDVLRDLADGSIRSFHAFKWRLAMALQPSSTAGICLGDVWRYWVALEMDPEALAARHAWPLETVRSIETYRGSTTHFAFPTLAEVRAGLATALTAVAIRQPAYELGERCPTLTLTPTGGC